MEEVEAGEAASAGAGTTAAGSAGAVGVSEEAPTEMAPAVSPPAARIPKSQGVSGCTVTSFSSGDICIFARGNDWSMRSR